MNGGDQIYGDYDMGYEISPPISNYSTRLPSVYGQSIKVSSETSSDPILYLPITDLAHDLFLSVARPKSPILTEPVVPVTKILSHLRSRCMIGGDREWRNCSPFKICRHQLFKTFKFTFRRRRRYLWKGYIFSDCQKHKTTS